MLLGAALPAHNLHHFQARGAIIKCTTSPLNPLSQPNFLDAQPLHSTEQTRKHLSNLENLLQSQSSPSEPVSVLSESDSGSKKNKGKGVFERLNLPRRQPEMKAAGDDIPSRISNWVQKILSNSQQSSPRNILGGRWRQYHGCDDWAGLLDPLDENLRREVVRYGEFVQAAYRCFHSNPATLADQSPLIRHVALSNKFYKVTKCLHATSSVGLPKWVDDVAWDLGWMKQKSSWIGYVAVCDDPIEIQRMGRRDIVVALRGTATCLEWIENMRDLLVHISEENDSPNGQSKVQWGFLSLYKTSGANVPSLAESVVKEVRRLIEDYRDETLSITVTGHSLGAALALLVGDELSTCAPNMPPVAVFTFGGPRVGNHAFANRIKSKNVKVLRVVNNQDIITRIPGIFVNEKLNQKLREYGAGGVLNVLDKSMPWTYSHVGTELKVDTKMSPYLWKIADAAQYHDLDAYLNLVDGFLASDSPFGAKNKSSMVK